MLPDWLLIKMKLFYWVKNVWESRVRAIIWDQTARLSWDLIYVTGALNTSGVHSNTTVHAMYLKSDRWLVWTFWFHSLEYICLVLLWRTMSFEMIRFKAMSCQFVEREGATALRYIWMKPICVCICLVLHMYISLPPPSEPVSQRGLIKLA